MEILGKLKCGFRLCSDFFDKDQRVLFAETTIVNTDRATGDFRVSVQTRVDRLCWALDIYKSELFNIMLVLVLLICKQNVEN